MSKLQQMIENEHVFKRCCRAPPKKKTKRNPHKNNPHFRKFLCRHRHDPLHSRLRCGFAHDESEINLKKAYKRVPCNHYWKRNKNGEACKTCPYIGKDGVDRCDFAHEDAAKTKEVQFVKGYKTKRCFFEKNGDKCPFGTDCIYIHQGDLDKKLFKTIQSILED
ncbi:MAG: hypothetical protein CMO44_02535 [Verrucomicrobiales bacterium]|nr:hypothetical protein [Verrucomicrobiales bacterium]